MNKLFTKNNEELFKLGYQAAKDNKSVNYDPFRNIDFISNPELKEKNDSWWAGYNSFKHQQKIDY